MFRPISCLVTVQLHWDDWEMETATSCTECSQLLPPNKYIDIWCDKDSSTIDYRTSVTKGLKAYNLWLHEEMVLSRELLPTFG